MYTWVNNNLSDGSITWNCRHSYFVQFFRDWHREARKYWKSSVYEFFSIVKTWWKEVNIYTIHTYALVSLTMNFLENWKLNIHIWRYKNSTAGSINFTLFRNNNQSLARAERPSQNSKLYVNEYFFQWKSFLLNLTYIMVQTWKKMCTKNLLFTFH